MTRETLGAFVVCFVVGPALFALVVRAGRRIVVPTALGVIAAVVAARFFQSRGVALAEVGALWLAWVLAVALVALALRIRLSAPSPRKLVMVTGLLATTMPWFGLATALTLVS